MPSNSEDVPSDRCFPETVYEDYALGRLTKDRRAEFERHIRQCVPCANHAWAVRDDAVALRDFLRGAQHVAGAPCPEHEELGLFLDQALDAERCSRIESHLGMCRGCQRRLVALYAETRKSMDPDAGIEDILGPRPEAANAVPFEPRDANSEKVAETHSRLDALLGLFTGRQVPAPDRQASSDGEGWDRRKGICGRE